MAIQQDLLKMKVVVSHVNCSGRVNMELNIGELVQRRKHEKFLTNKVRTFHNQLINRS